VSGLHAIELDYKSDTVQIPVGGEYTLEKKKYYAVIILPKKSENFDKIFERAPKIIEELNKLEMYTTLDLALPKFEFEFDISLKETLISMGMELPFIAAGDFSGIPKDGEKGLFIGSVVQKAKLKVDVEGTTAAVATGYKMSSKSAKKTQSFLVNRPFAFLIMARRVPEPAFAAIVNRPSEYKKVVMLKRKSRRFK